MKTWIIISGIINLLLAVIWLTTLKIKIEAKRVDSNDLIHVELRAWMGLIRIRQDIPVIKFKDMFKGPVVERSVESPVTDQKIVEQKKRVPRMKMKQNMQKLIKIIQNTYQFQRILKKFLKKVKVDDLRWQTTIGTGDAAETGMLSGLIWSIKGSIIGVISQYLSLQTVPRINVSPSFQHPELSVHFVCIVRIRIGNAIVAGIRVFLNLRKGREQNGRTPYSRLNDNSDGKLEGNG